MAGRRARVGDQQTTFAVGLGAGLVEALILDDAMALFLYGVSAGDPRIQGIIEVGLAAVELVAPLLPARRASWISPLQG